MDNIGDSGVAIADQHEPTTTCLFYFDNGNKAWVIRLANAIQVGTACADGHGNSGFAVTQGLQVSKTCSFLTGPKAGQIMDFNGLPNVTYAVVGHGCMDSLGDRGIAIQDREPSASSAQHRRKHA